MKSKLEIVKTFVLLVIVCFAVSGLLMLIAPSLLSFKDVRHILDKFEPDQSATIFNIELYMGIVARLRLIGIALCLVSGSLYILRQRVQKYISSVLNSMRFLPQNLVWFVRDNIKKEEKLHIYTFILLLIVSIFLRVYFLNQPMRYDESLTFINYVSRPLLISISYYSEPNNHIFYTLLVRIVYLVLGNQPWIIRLPALFAGVLMIPVLYVVVRVYYNKHAALLSVGISSALSALILYSTNARGYTLISLIFLITLFLSKWLTHSENVAIWFLFGVLFSLGFYTIPIMLYPFGIVITWIFIVTIFTEINVNKKMMFKNLFTAIAVTVSFTSILYLPVLAASGLSSATGNQYVTPSAWDYFLASLPLGVTELWEQWNLAVPTGITVLLAIGFLISTVFHKQLATDRIPLVLAVIVWCVPILVVQRRFPYTRVWLFLLPLYIGIASAGILYLLKPIESRIGRFKTIIVATLALTLSCWMGLNVIRTQSVYYSNETGTLRDANQITAFLEEYLEPGDRVLTSCPSNMPLEYSFILHGIPKQPLHSDLDSSERIIVVVNDAEGQTLEEILDSKEVAITDYSAPRLVQEYKFASLYQLNRAK